MPTLEDAIAIVEAKANGRTRFAGQEAFIDELLLGEIYQLRADMEVAWGIIANAFGGDWDLAQKGWKEAAERWRDEAWHRIAGEVYAKRAREAPVATTTELETLEDAIQEAVANQDFYKAHELRQQKNALRAAAVPPVGTPPERELDDVE